MPSYREEAGNGNTDGPFAWKWNVGWKVGNVGDKIKHYSTCVTSSLALMMGTPDPLAEGTLNLFHPQGARIVETAYASLLHNHTAVIINMLYFEK